MIKVNHEHYKVTGDNTVTVTVEFDMNPKCSERDILINAADYLKFYADNKVHKSWGRRLGYEWAVERVKSRKQKFDNNK